MDVLQPVDIVGDDGVSGLDAPMIGVDRRFHGSQSPEPRGRRESV
jgi:hypothetical protein